MVRAKLGLPRELLSDPCKPDLDLRRSQGLAASPPLLLTLMGRNPRLSRSKCMAVRILVLIVPKGAPSFLAMSEWVSSP